MCLHCWLNHAWKAPLPVRAFSSTNKSPKIGSLGLSCAEHVPVFADVLSEELLDVTQSYDTVLSTPRIFDSGPEGNQPHSMSAMGLRLPPS